MCSSGIFWPYSHFCSPVCCKNKKPCQYNESLLALQAQGSYKLPSLNKFSPAFASHMPQHARYTTVSQCYVPFHKSLTHDLIQLVRVACLGCSTKRARSPLVPASPGPASSIVKHCVGWLMHGGCLCYCFKLLHISVFFSRSGRPNTS